MQPPSDSIRHHLQKLAEARATRNPSSTPLSTLSPTAAPPPYTLSVTRPSGTRIMNIDQYDSEDPYASPINIQIDGLINVVGDGNTITLPSSWLGSPATPTVSETPSSNPRLSSLAAVIIAALNRANSLYDDLGNPRPLNIDIKAGFRVHGCHNTIHTMDAVPSKESVDSAAGPDIEHETETANVEGSERKRRASSVSTLIRQRSPMKLNH
ncbi:hypothetical protein N7457_002384 [Penicillium paradoxum]|uniref:uncharacterized protein n=1 Tax=Penicillium paradoxum TaxID=176176 RepID=UPI0025486786|nr:uncharacterized protein N7457_002384 [Penicillium paradoxum]KAJ5787394.1 hypothetical protein N7457_002384 [Penicillium paradoxum]